MTKYVSVCTDPLIIHPIIPSIKYVLWDINIELTGNMTKYVTVCTDPLMSPVAQLENLILHCVIKLCISDMYCSRYHIDNKTNSSYRWIIPLCFQS